MFNVPGPVALTVGLFVAVHLVRVYFLSERAEFLALVRFAFIPARYASAEMRDLALFNGGAEVWSFLTYALLHADWTHLILNSIWLVAFGSIVARRFGTLRFFIFLIATAVAGAAAHLFTHFGELQPVIGASASVSGCMGAAIRFMFSKRPLRREDGFPADSAPSLLASLRDGRVLAFVAVWFGINLVFGLGAMPLLGEDQSVAWEAHVGGFLVGLLLFRMFDPSAGVMRAAAQEDGSRNQVGE